ncbi:MAG: N-acetylmuramoyl-L-alanine amidase [Bacteriovoracaceae bacterium]
MKYFLFALFIFHGLALAEDCIQCDQNTSTPLPTPPLEWPLELIKIEPKTYERNLDVDYCKRPTEMIDTIVLHHSETFSTTTPEMINDIHLDNKWHMVGYSYVINTPYSGNKTPTPVVSEGRPIDFVGSHAGKDIFVPMNADQKKMWDDGKVVCGFEGSEFKVDPSILKDGNIKANVTTIGVVVVGNYSPFSASNPNGYRRGKTRNPTKQTLDMVARLSCQLQKKYPNIKNIKWHNYYHSTSCPGNIKKYIGQIISQARSYGCEFQ